MSDTKTTPEVLWAQRSSSTDPERNYVYLTIAAPDVPPKSFKADLKASSLTFTGRSDTKKTTYHVELELYGEIDVDNSKTHHTSRDVIFVLRKKDLKQDFWPRLLKESKKVHFVKTDFDKWVDEDEQDGAPEEDISGMNGMPDMGGMGGMGGGMGDGGFGGIDFSKLGAGAGGMPDMSGMPDLGSMNDGGDDDGDDDEDEDMPGLEGDEEAAEEKEEGGEGGVKGKGKEGVEAPAASAPSKKIEELS